MKTTTHNIIRESQGKLNNITVRQISFRWSKRYKWEIVLFLKGNGIWKGEMRLSVGIFQVERWVKIEFQKMRKQYAKNYLILTKESLKDVYNREHLLGFLYFAYLCLNKMVLKNRFKTCSRIYPNYPIYTRNVWGWKCWSYIQTSHWESGKTKILIKILCPQYLSSVFRRNKKKLVWFVHPKCHSKKITYIGQYKSIWNSSLHKHKFAQRKA